MAINRIELDHFTVFEEMVIPFRPGINVLLGENGFGKTHIRLRVICSIWNIKVLI